MAIFSMAFYGNVKYAARQAYLRWFRLALPWGRKQAHHVPQSINLGTRGALFSIATFYLNNMVYAYNISFGAGIIAWRCSTEIDT